FWYLVGRIRGPENSFPACLRLESCFHVQPRELSVAPCFFIFRILIFYFGPIGGMALLRECVLKHFEDDISAIGWSSACGDNGTFLAHVSSRSGFEHRKIV